MTIECRIDTENVTGAIRKCPAHARGTEEEFVAQEEHGDEGEADRRHSEDVVMLQTVSSNHIYKRRHKGKSDKGDKTQCPAAHARDTPACG